MIQRCLLEPLSGELIGLSDEEWFIIGTLLPSERGSGCHPALDDRLYFGEMKWIAWTGSQWRHLRAEIAKRRRGKAIIFSVRIFALLEDALSHLRNTTYIHTGDTPLENWDPIVVRLLSIFMPSAFKRRTAITLESRFVHYTTAANLHQILDREEIWFRSSEAMNDHQDIEDGVTRLQHWLNQSDSAVLVDALDRCAPGVWWEGLEKYQHWLPKLKSETYVLSVTEHDMSENNAGRLSLWRAFDRHTVGVAVVVNSAPFMQVSDALKAYSTPVSYWTRQQFVSEFQSVAKLILDNQDFIYRSNRSVLREIIFLMLFFAATCSKHPGLRDEREWRVLTNPLLWPTDKLTKDNHADGTRRAPYRMALKNNPKEGVHGLEFPELISRVIVGPAVNAEIVREEIISKLAEKNVSQPELKVVLSRLPVRGNEMGLTMDISG